MLQATMTKVCNDGLQGKDVELPNVDKGTWKQCVEHSMLTAHASMGEKTFKEIVKSKGHWVFEEDVPGKPGWIAWEGSPKEIVFTNIPIKVGGLRIQYLQTYENAGDVTCLLEDPKSNTQVKSITLKGLWQECASLEMTSEYFDIPKGKYDLRCKSDGAKFKLLGLHTC